MVGWFGGSNTLDIQCHSVVFLASDALDEATLLKGRLLLDLKRKAQVKLTVALTGTCEINFDGQSQEKQQIFSKLISLDETKELQEGHHIFEFETELSNRSPASVEVGHGKVYYTLKAEAKGLASFGYDLVKELPLQVVWSAGGERALPPGIESYGNEWDPELGPWGFRMWSPALTVGGLLSSWYHYETRQMGGTPFSIHKVLIETITIHSLIEPTKVVFTSSSEHVLSSLENLEKTTNLIAWERASSGVDKCPPAEAQTVVQWLPNGKRAIKHLIAGVPENVGLARLPGHTLIHPSTHKADPSPIKVTHEVAWRTVYRNAAGKGRRHTCTRAISLASCSCMVATLVLPSYSQQQRADSLRNGLWCVCEESMDELVAEHKVDIEAFAVRCDLPNTGSEEDRRVSLSSTKVQST